jgi:hypothetical protein
MSFLWETIGKQAERTDKVVTQVKDQLKNFKARDAGAIEGVDGKLVVGGANSMYYQTFEDPVHDAWTLTSGDKSAITYPNNGKAGGKALRTTSKAVWITSNANIPFDPDRLYRIRTRVRKISGTTRDIYVGLMGYAADGTTIVDRNGTAVAADANFVALKGTISSTSWATYQGYVKGVAATGTASAPVTDPSAPAVLHEDTRYFRPFLALSQGADDGIQEIDYITIEVLTETLEVNEILDKVGGESGTDADKVAAAVDNSTGNVASNKVQHSSIATGAISGGGEDGATKNHIVTGSIVSGNIKALAIQVGHLSSLSQNGLTIDFTATGSDKLINHAGFWLDANGNASFGGDITATSMSSSSMTVNSGGAVANQTKIGPGYLQLSLHSTEYGFVGWAQGSEPGYESTTIVRAYSTAYTSKVLIDGDAITLSGDVQATGDLGFFNGTPASKSSVSDLSSLITISGTGDDANLNTNFTNIETKLNQLLNALQSYNLV